MTDTEPLSRQKAHEYIADRFPMLAGTPLVADSIAEDFRAGFVQGLEAATNAIVHADSDGLASQEIRALLAAEV